MVGAPLHRLLSSAVVATLGLGFGVVGGILAVGHKRG
jgi:hypothetical protein